MSSPYLGQIEAFAFGFAPKNWALCQGQLMSIAQNQALFALLGTQFGGNGVQTFALPDLRSRIAIGTGSTPMGTQQGYRDSHTDNEPNPEPHPYRQCPQ